MLFTPINKYLLVEAFEIPKERDSLIELPEEYKKKSGGRYIPVRFLSCAPDCTGVYGELFDVEDEVILVVDQSMIEDILIGDSKYSIIHQNHIVGIIAPMEGEYET